MAQGHVERIVVATGGSGVGSVMAVIQVQPPPVPTRFALFRYAHDGGDILADGYTCNNGSIGGLHEVGG